MSHVICTPSKPPKQLNSYCAAQCHEHIVFLTEVFTNSAIAAHERNECKRYICCNSVTSFTIGVTFWLAQFSITTWGIHIYTSPFCMFQSTIYIYVPSQKALCKKIQFITVNPYLGTPRGCTEVITLFNTTMLELWGSQNATTIFPKHSDVKWLSMVFTLKQYE